MKLRSKYYIEIEKVTERRKLKSISDISLSETKEGYTSLYWYDYDALEHIEKNKTIAGFQGNVYGEYFVLDLDGDGTTWGDIINVTKKILNDFPKEEYFLFFSGKKGFHIYVNKGLVDYDESYENKWNEISKIFASYIVEKYPDSKKYIDFAIYDKARIFRKPFSIHPKSNKQKKLLKIENNKIIEEKGIEKEIVLGLILNGYECQQEKIVDLNDFNSEKEDINESINQEVKKYKADYFEYVPNDKHCITAILNTKDLEGQRHSAALRLQAYWNDKGYPQSYIKTLMKEWNSRLVNPLQKEELNYILKYIDKYKFGCSDGIKAQFCKRTCYLYKSKNVEDSFVHTGNKYINSLIEEMNNNDEKQIVMNDVFEGFNLSPIKTSYVITIVAGAGVGKTTFLLNIMKKTPKVNWLFFSLEMPAYQITEKLIKMDLEKEKLEVKDVMNYQMQDNIITIDKPDIRVDNLESYINMLSEETQITFDAVAIDYVGLLDAKGIAKERMFKISKTIKNIAKKHKTKIFILSQVPKDKAGDGNMPIGMDSPKDSGEIANLSDMMLALWRPNIGHSQRTDNIINVNVAKNRHGRAQYIVPLECNLKYYQINRSLN